MRVALTLLSIFGVPCTTTAFPTTKSAAVPACHSGVELGLNTSIGVEAVKCTIPDLLPSLFCTVIDDDATAEMVPLTIPCTPSEPMGLNVPEEDMSAASCFWSVCICAISD